jgi:16S rRNA (uracil1498-N3)-methyltransferase
MQHPYFFEPLLPATSALFTVSEETSKHCVQVLRMQAREKIVLTNGEGLLSEATIVNADKKRMVVQTGIAKKKERAAVENVLAISFVKNPSRIEWLLEKITEIGVTEIIPLICERTERSIYKAERWNSILISAMLQSKQAYKPILREPTKLNELLSENFEGASFIAHCMEGTAPIKSYLPLAKRRRVIIGPEGDFTSAEIAQAIDKGFLALDLGDTRLRTETAGLVVVTLLQHH